MKNPTLLIMLPVSTDNDFADGPDVVLVDLTVADCKRLLARQAIARKMKSDDSSFYDMHFCGGSGRYYRSEKAPLLHEDQVCELTNHVSRKNHLCRIIDAEALKEQINSGEFFRDEDEEYMEGCLVGVDETSFWWKAYENDGDNLYTSQFLDGKAIEIFVRRYG